MTTLQYQDAWTCIMPFLQPHHAFALRSSSKLLFEAYTIHEAWFLKHCEATLQLSSLSNIHNQKLSNSKLMYLYSVYYQSQHDAHFLAQKEEEIMHQANNLIKHQRFLKEEQAACQTTSLKCYIFSVLFIMLFFLITSFWYLPLVRHSLYCKYCIIVTVPISMLLLMWNSSTDYSLFHGVGTSLMWAILVTALETFAIVYSALVVLIIVLVMGFSLGNVMGYCLAQYYYASAPRATRLGKVSESISKQLDFKELELHVMQSEQATILYTTRKNGRHRHYACALL